MRYPMPHALCLLPHDHCIVVRVYAPHGCGGMYIADAWCYGPLGRVGMFMGYR